MSKYDPLRIYLKNAANDMTEVTLTFQQIERILDDSLPRSAREYREWWDNTSTETRHVQTKAWLASGWKVDTVDQKQEWVRFRRTR